MASLNDRVPECLLGLGAHEERIADHPECGGVSEVVEVVNEHRMVESVGHVGTALLGLEAVAPV